MEQGKCKGARRDQEAIIFIEVGGGMGHEGLPLEKGHPHLPGRFVNQTLPQVISGQEMWSSPWFKTHDSLSPQPLTGKGLKSSRNHGFPKGVHLFGLDHHDHERRVIL